MSAGYAYSDAATAASGLSQQGAYQHPSPQGAYFSPQGPPPPPGGYYPPPGNPPPTSAHAIQPMSYTPQPQPQAAYVKRPPQPQVKHKRTCEDRCNTCTSWYDSCLWGGSASSSSYV